MLIYTFRYGNDSDLPRQLIGTIEGYQARTAYLHLTGRNLMADVNKHGVYYTVKAGHDYNLYPVSKLTDCNQGMD